MNASLIMLGLSLVAYCLIFDKGAMAEDSGWMVLVPQTRMAGEAINSGTPIPATLADKVPNEDAWIVGAYDNGYMKMVKIQVTSANTYKLIASKYAYNNGTIGTYPASCLTRFSSDDCFGGEDQLTPAYQVQIVAVKAQCPNQDWEYGTALCEDEFSDHDFLVEFYETSRLYCCEQKISEECRPCSNWYYGNENCTETCRKDIEKTREECQSNNDKYEVVTGGYTTKDDINHEWEEGKKGAALCSLKYLVQESVCAKDGESCKENYCCDGFLCDGQVCRKDETPCWDYSSSVVKCKDIVAEDPDDCKYDAGIKALCPVTCGCKKCNIRGCAMD